MPEVSSSLVNKSGDSSYRLLTQIIESRQFQQRFTLSRTATAELVKKGGWRELLNRLDSKPVELVCARLLEYCRPTLDQLSSEPEEGWLLFSHSYAVDLSYPNNEFSPRAEAFGDGALFFFAVLQAYFLSARRRGQMPQKLDYQMPVEEELAQSEYRNEYRAVVKRFSSCFVYEMMMAAREVTPFLTLEHIIGVHNLAMAIGREMKKAGAPVDLALLSAAAAIHDVGKFGCQGSERVPYLHYYYTELWCKAAKAPSIGRLAANHSTWDLELENLSVESLLLIYADFRVRQRTDESGVKRMEVYTLADSFEVILNKMVNVDKAKRRRYSYVYSKLRDFEDYMRSLGVDVDDTGNAAPTPAIDIALMTPREVLEAFKFLGIAHNIALMHRLDTERLFGNILEAARSEKDWKNLRAYIDILEEYFIYLGTNQKKRTLSFLYELLIHREGDIRRAAAALIGNIIAHFEYGYRKELPPGVIMDEDETGSMQMWRKYLHDILIPDHKLTEQHKSWLGYSLKNVAASAIGHCPQEEKRAYLAEIWTYFTPPAQPDDWTAFVLLDMLNYLPLALVLPSELEKLYNFAVYAARREPLELRTAALRVLRCIAELDNKTAAAFRERLRDLALGLDEQGIPALIYHKGLLLRQAGMNDDDQQALLNRSDIVSDIFLDNLKMATPWIIKSVNIQLLLDQVNRGSSNQLLHIAAHFANLLKVSERVVVRHEAGAALVRIAPLLPPDQRNEIATELAKGLEVGEYAFSKYIPIYLGEFALWLKPEELDELIALLTFLLNSSANNIVAVSLDTIGILLECYADYHGRFEETEAAYYAREQRLLGLLLKGLASYRDTVRQEALLVIGKSFFASTRIGDQDKRRLFSKCYKKLLSLISENQEGALSFFYRAAALNHIYRFIATQMLLNNGFDFPEHNKLAFFPGTFDPFTLSHKGIVREICGMGFEVMLAIDEFSWSKNAQPRKLRRQIATMSLADEMNVHIFPDSIPANLANPEDLRRLRLLFPERQLYIVVGTDVVAQASSYTAPPQPDSVHHFDHIIFRRSKSGEESVAVDEQALHRIDGDIIYLSLPTSLEDISSSRIRENIDNNRDISYLIDLMAQEYIYHNSLYLREPQYKPILKARAIGFEQIEKPNTDQISELLANMPYKNGEAGLIAQSIALREERLILLRNSSRRDAIEGFVAFRELAGTELLGELHDTHLAEAVRRRAAGKLLLISGIYTWGGGGLHDTEQLLLTEVLDWALRQDFTYAIFHQKLQLAPGVQLLGVLQRQGFLEVSLESNNEQVFVADMRSPIVLIQNLETALKEPLASNDKVLSTIVTATHRLQTALADLYPGNLVLTVSTGVIHHRLINKITELNQVPAYPLEPRVLGPNMCVPFGKILRGKVVPNTVTKTLHTDKVFEPDIKRWTIEAYPFYSSLEDQIRTIKSFRQPVILVDDILHSADRLRTLHPMFEKQGIDVVKVMVGVMSGRGRDLITMMNREVESVYYIPNLRSWFVESSIYPFIGGDTVRREGRSVANLLPAVNLILPYASPPLDNNCSRQSVFDFSLTCLKNARDILLALESEYLLLFGRNLTLNRLSEAVMLPLVPDKGDCMNYDPGLTASVYLDNEIEMLLRTRRVII
jgi:nicotinic acid mononucleotide adenylyltransferase